MKFERRPFQFLSAPYFLPRILFEREGRMRLHDVFLLMCFYEDERAHPTAERMSGTRHRQKKLENMVRGLSYGLSPEKLQSAWDSLISEGLVNKIDDETVELNEAGIARAERLDWR